MDITTEQVTNVGEHGQTKLNYYDTKMRYKNLKNEVHCLEKKKKVVLKEDIPAEEKESITNQLGSKQNELEQAKEVYKQKEMIEEKKCSIDHHNKENFN